MRAGGAIGAKPARLGEQAMVTVTRPPGAHAAASMRDLRTVGTGPLIGEDRRGRAAGGIEGRGPRRAAAPPPARRRRPPPAPANGCRPGARGTARATPGRASPGRSRTSPSASAAPRSRPGRRTRHTARSQRHPALERATRRAPLIELDVPRRMPGASPRIDTRTRPSAVSIATCGSVSAASASAAWATPIAWPTGRPSRATSVAVSRATLRASVRAWFHSAAWKPANIRTTTIGVRSTTVSDVEPRSRRQGGARHRRVGVRLVADLGPDDAGDHRHRHAGGHEPQHLLQRDRATIAIRFVDRPRRRAAPWTASQLTSSS